MIYNGPSIYKFGGGGGGYKDGGKLVDADFIKVENNTISSYENVNRDPVNFYIELKDGEIANSIVELTTAVNSTINVYVLNNGLYYILGNVGGNTVTAGDNYKVNITGDSYAVQLVSAPPTPEYVVLNGNEYKIIYNNGLLWLCSNYKDDSFESHVSSGNYFFNFNSIKNINIDGWRLPSVSEFDNLYNSLMPDATNKLKSVSGWKDNKNGTNESGFNAFPLGMWKNQYHEMANQTEFAQFMAQPIGGVNYGYSANYNDNYWSYGPEDSAFWLNVRLVKEYV